MGGLATVMGYDFVLLGLFVFGNFCVSLAFFLFCVAACYSNINVTEMGNLSLLLSTINYQLNYINCKSHSQCSSRRI